MQEGACLQLAPDRLFQAPYRQDSLQDCLDEPHKTRPEA